MPPNRYRGPPMTLANMRENGVRKLVPHGGLLLVGEHALEFDAPLVSANREEAAISGKMALVALDVITAPAAFGISSAAASLYTRSKL